MQSRNRALVIASIVALVGFNTPLCAVACSSDSVERVHSGVSGPDSSSVESNLDCHGSRSEGRGGSTRHECEMSCDSLALTAFHHDEIQRAATNVLLSPNVGYACDVRPWGAADLASDRREPPPPANILLLKSSLQI